MKKQLNRFFVWLLDDKIRRHRWAFVLQSALLALYVLLAFFLLSRVENQMYIASLAATGFIVFAFPSAKSSGPRFLVGGYILAGLWGCAFSFLHKLLPEDREPARTILVCTAAVFFMALSAMMFNFEHPPALAMAVSLVLDPAPHVSALLALILVLLLLAAKRLLKNRLTDN